MLLQAEQQHLRGASNAQSQRISAKERAGADTCRDEMEKSPGIRLSRRKALEWRGSGTKKPVSENQFFCELAEREGFEPSIRDKPYTPLAGERLQPLGHLSGKSV